MGRSDTNGVPRWAAPLNGERCQAAGATAQFAPAAHLGRCVPARSGLYVCAMRTRHPLSVMMMVVLLGASCGPRTGVKPASGSAAAIDDQSIRDVVNRVARHQLRPLADGEYPAVEGDSILKVADAAKPPEGIAWLYPWGVTLYGAIRSTDATGDKDVEHFVLEHNQI